MVHRHVGVFVRVAALALVLGAPVAAQAQIAVSSSVNGAAVSLAWNAVPGADGYVVQAGLSSGQYLTVIPATPTGLAINAPAVGTYVLRTVALSGQTPIAFSNEVTVTVTSLVAPPSPPASLEPYVYCGGVMLRWTPGPGATPAGYLVTVNGPVSFNAVPVIGTELFAPAPPQGAYSVSIRAVATSGAQSADTAPVAFTVAPGPGTAPPPVVRSSIYGPFVNLSWSPVPGAASYSLQATLNGAPVLNAAVPPSQTALSQTVPFANYTFQVTANTVCGGQSAAGQSAFVVDGAPPAGPRAPNPAPGQRLPALNKLNVVERVANARRDLLLQSCRESGGNNRFMFEVLKELRKEDTRWGLNWKRGNRGDLSQDAVTYNYGSGPDEDTTEVYIFDIIGGHCGGNPGAFWQDQTLATLAGGTIGRFTLIPYLNAGYVP